MTEHADPPVASDMADLVAFEVEGSGSFLVPLDVLAPFQVAPLATAPDRAVVGWGWALPIVRWNTFHRSQVETPIQLSAGVVATLRPQHFVHPSSRPTERGD